MRLSFFAHRSLGNCPPAGEERSERQLDDEDQLDPSESRVLRRTLRDREILGGTQRRYLVFFVPYILHFQGNI